MFNMDEGGEGTSWVGNIFSKFENLFCEADEVVKQEMEHVENQLQIFRANVVQFCSNFMEEEESQFLKEETKSDIDIDEDHYKKESNNPLSSSSVEHIDEVQVDTSVEQIVDSKAYEKLEASEMSDVVASKNEDVALDNVDGCDHSVETEESGNLMVYISSTVQSSNSVNAIGSCASEVVDTDVIPADASAKSVEGILKNDVKTKQDTETNSSFDKVNSDVNLIDHQAPSTRHVDEERRKKQKKQWLAFLRKNKQEKARPQLTEKSETDHESDGVIQNSEESETDQDSDWVVV